MFLLGLILPLLYWPQIYGPATSPRWAFLAIVLPILILWLYKPTQFTIIHLLGICFLGWCTISLYWSVNVYDGINDLFIWIILAEAFVLGTLLTDLKWLFVGLALAIAGSSLANYNLFVNPNILAETALIVAVGLWVYNVKWLILPLLPAIILNGSRGAILVGCCLFVGAMVNRNRFVALCTVLLLAIAGSISYYYDFKLIGIEERLTLWKDTLAHVSLFGYGIGSFFHLYPLMTEDIDTLLKRPRYAHNDLLQIWFELGFVGLGLILSIIWLSVKQNYVLLTIVMVSLFSFPLHLPVTVFLAGVVCGYTVIRRYGIRNTALTGRMVLQHSRV